ncbi:hypothetical protein SBD_3578 [Streptomyces bottropensis ATCC 25435]|uniref:Uncharacterized protein n=1 Tax=Streptomyces bottropensis ATCC 25435 TaxID=1054862 RepID=M3DEG2_9ACTN|nr:hypothetical protein SBD_3578 [Streptomyces bottropensis ATCC 25435]
MFLTPGLELANSSSMDLFSYSYGQVSSAGIQPGQRPERPSR